LKILLSSNEEGFLHAVHENFEVEASTEAGRSIKNDTLFDNEESNPIGMSNSTHIQTRYYLELEND
jgi:hypothetical protein